jgi:uncharacterized membrane protein
MNLIHQIVKAYKKITNGIVFLPAVISIAISAFAFLIDAAQHMEAGTEILKAVVFIHFENANTVRSLLSALLTGIISLTVFSFTMVMVVVNQSASNYSPKVIDEFINKTINQVILGIYTGSIFFLIICLVQVKGSGDFSVLPHFNVFVSVILIAACLVLFIFFINDISGSVRINNVADRIFRQTKGALLRISGDQNDKPPGIEEWFPYAAGNTGYFQSINSKILLSILKRENLVLRVRPYYGTYLLSKHVLFYLDKEIKEESLLNKIRSTFVTYPGENIRENYFYGFRQLREVAVKALSPGINDPGIAVICLDYLSELLSLYLSLEKKSNLADKDGAIRVLFKRHTFAELLTLTVTPVVTYGKSDFIVLGHILLTLGTISLYDASKEHQMALLTYAEHTRDMAKEHITSKPEIEYINNVIKITCESGYFKLTAL